MLCKLGRFAPLFSLLPILASCIIPEDTSRRVRENPTTAAAKKEMVGLSEADLRMCAGFPTASADLGEDGRIWTYQREVRRGSLNVVLPTNSVGVLPALGGSVNVAPGGYCHTQIRLREGRVAEVAFAGDNNEPNSLNTLCVAMVDGCVAYAREHEGRLKHAR